MDKQKSMSICYLQLFCIGFNSMPNLIVFLFNHLYHVFYVRFYCMGCVWESVKTQAPIEESEDFAGISREAFPRSESHAEHMSGMRRVMIAGFREYFAGKAFPRDTHETFYFAFLEYLLHHVFTHTIYTHITHILKEVLFKEKTLAITLES